MTHQDLLAIIEEGVENGRISRHLAAYIAAEVLGIEARETGYDDLVRSTAVDAFIVTDTYLGNPQAAWLRQRRAPFVAFGRPWDDDDAERPELVTGMYEVAVETYRDIPRAVCSCVDRSPADDGLRGSEA